MSGIKILHKLTIERNEEYEVNYLELLGALTKHLRLKVEKGFLNNNLAICLEFDEVEIDRAYIEKEDIEYVLNSKESSQ